MHRIQGLAYNESLLFMLVQCEYDLLIETRFKNLLWPIFNYLRISKARVETQGSLSSNVTVFSTKQTSANRGHNSTMVDEANSTRLSPKPRQS